MTNLAAQQPALLVITPNTIRAALTVFGDQMGQEPSACLPLLVEDPGERARRRRALCRAYHS